MKKMNRTNTIKEEKKKNTSKEERGKEKDKKNDKAKKNDKGGKNDQSIKNKEIKQVSPSKEKKGSRGGKHNKSKTPRQSPVQIIKNNLRLLCKVFRHGTLFLSDIVIFAVIRGFFNSAEAIFTVKLFDAIDKGAEFREIIGIIGLMAAVYVAYYAIHAIHGQVIQPLSKQKLSLNLHGELFRKAHTLDVACYDDPVFYNDFVWAMDEASRRSEEVVNDLGNMIASVVTFGTLIGLLFTIDIVVSVILIGSAVLTVVINQIANKLEFEQEKEWKPLSRVRSYINRVYQLSDYSKELRISHVGDLMMDKMDENTEKRVEVSVKYGKKFFLLYGVCNQLVSDLIYFGILFYMFTRLLSGNILIGAFAASVNMNWRVRWQLATFVESLMKFPKHSLFLEKYYGFLAYEPKVVSGGAPVRSFESLELRNVSFTYDFSDKPKYEYHDADWKPAKGDGGSGEALKNVNMTLKKGEKIAIVGYNGAGKTTLIKLLMRLYDPTSGQVLLNGTDAREYDLQEYRDLIGTVFQDFKIFAATVGENVMNGKYDPEAHRDTVLTALDAAGFTEKLNKLEKGVDTVLTREFDKKGTNLSGGEGQKVAIARVFARPYELIIMDEPSSALDPVAEYELNQAILKYAADKTVIFISHRLSTTRMADRIYMFASGELAEVGSHDELMELNGKYAEMFNLQAEKYKVG